MSLAALLILTLLAAADPVPSATPPPAKLEFPLEGYRINALDSSTKTQYAFTMSLPGSGNNHSFPSVKVDRRPTMKVRPSYQDIKDAKTLRGYNGDTILMERTASPAEWLMEYTSNQTSITNKTGPKQHIYQRMVSANGMTYDISATAPDAQWPEFGPKLKACVDSFELSPDPVPGKLAFPQQGYRISALDGPAPADANEELLSIGSVHVGIEPYTKTLKEYQAEHKPRMTTFPVGQLKILAEYAPAENALVTEYDEEVPENVTVTGKIFAPQGGQVLIYQKVVLAHGQLYWAAGLHWDWDKAASSTQIKACVESLEAIPAPPTGPIVQNNPPSTNSTPASPSASSSAN